ncbi:MAG: HugZ family pyridoxamine 5'-phosphate oxidase [Gammaproteobacteria bacterium]
MKTNNESESSRVAEACRRLIASQQTLLLSTCSSENRPDIGYAPFVVDEKGSFYIFISELAKHTQNLRGHSKASILFIQPESECRNLFARERLVLCCSAEETLTGRKEYGLMLEALEIKFGGIVAVLRSLPDFHLFKLAPESGQYIAGFGQAFALSLKQGELYPAALQASKED